MLSGCVWAFETGTDNEELLQSQFYVGSKHKRVRGEVYYELLDEFISAAKRRYASVVPSSYIATSPNKTNNRISVSRGGALLNALHAWVRNTCLGG